MYSRPVPTHTRPSQSTSQPQAQPQNTNTQSTTTASRQSTRPSTTGPATSHTTNPSPLLQARIAAKQKELADLHELRDLSGQLATQMSMLEEKLGTLASGTEAVALVLSNWHSVLSAISMASSKLAHVGGAAAAAGEETDHAVAEDGAGALGAVLPETLVRIPVQYQQQQQLAGETTDGVWTGTSSGEAG